MKAIQAYIFITKHKDKKIEDFYKDIQMALRKNNCYYTFLIRNFNIKISKQMDKIETD